MPAERKVVLQLPLPLLGRLGEGPADPGPTGLDLALGAGGRVPHRDQADVGQLPVPGIDDLHGQDVVASGGHGQARLPAGSDLEVGDDRHQARRRATAEIRARPSVRSVTPLLSSRGVSATRCSRWRRCLREPRAGTISAGPRPASTAPIRFPSRLVRSRSPPRRRAPGPASRTGRCRSRGGTSGRSAARSAAPARRSSGGCGPRTAGPSRSSRCGGRHPRRVAAGSRPARCRGPVRGHGGHRGGGRRGGA